MKNTYSKLLEYIEKNDKIQRNLCLYTYFSRCDGELRKEEVENTREQAVELFDLLFDLLNDLVLFSKGQKNNGSVNVSNNNTLDTTTIDDHVCVSCGNQKCSKSEKACWKCGTKI